MNKGDLINCVAHNAGLSKADGKRAVDSMFKCMSQALKKGHRITVVGFGSWYVSKGIVKYGRNPLTGKDIKIPAKSVVKFKVGSDLANVVK